MFSVVAMRRKHPFSRSSSRKTLSSIPEEQSCTEWLPLAGSPTRSRKQIDNGIAEQEIAVTEMCYKLVDDERQNNQIATLARSGKLHQLARLHANDMAKQGKVFHPVKDLAGLQHKLESSLVGANVQRGKSPISMHKTAMKNLVISRDNILGCDFQEYGVAAAQGLDGRLYLCQYFR